MELDTLESEQQFVNRVNTSPFFMSSRTPVSSPQPWELHDVDFLLPGPVTGSSRSFFQDSSRKNLLESGISFSTELEDVTKPMIFRSGTYWHDLALNDCATNEFSTYLVDEVLSDKEVPTVSRSPSKIVRNNVAPPTKLWVNASACTDDELTGKRHCRSEDTLKNTASPTMMDKKILVTDNDLRLFSSDNMKALRGKKTPVKNSSRVQNHRKKTKGALPMTIYSAAPAAQYKKRRASFEAINEHTVHALKRTKSLNQQVWAAPSFDPRWYVGMTDGFHGMQPRLLSPINTSTSLEFSGANVC